MSDNEITLPSSSSHNDDPADLSRQASTLTTSTASSHRDTQAEQDVLDDDSPVDPRIAALRAMFPDYDDSVLQSILESVGGDQNSAIEVLLGMSDPQYKSETQHDHVQLSQVDLDEQLARRLMLEEQHAASAQLPQQAQQQPMLPYEPYTGSTRRAHRPQQQPQAYPNNADNERDTMTDIQDRFGRIAETGKKTFESLFSKVKAKIQEYDKPGKPEPPNQEPQWVGVSSAPSQRWSYNSAGVQQAPYYDPNPSTPPPPPLPVVASKPLPSPKTIKGYDVDTEQTAGPSRSESDPASDVSSPRTSMGSRPITAIDGGKLGLLPKRPVSLLKQQGTESAKEPVREDSIESNDELEYAENPFEESRN
ncbi:hypothetical protein JOM56_002092 [Amanita muscaria]